MEAAEIVCFGILFLIEKAKRLKLKIESMVVFGFFINKRFHSLAGVFLQPAEFVFEAGHVAVRYAGPEDQFAEK